ncbi:MAG: hypothetical protein IPM18_17280 [Phycisphaerales bacterium]|nr:hypothetical protein [Phycisphaerales bacterium]
MAARRARFDPTDSTTLQPEQRLHEVAAILAAGMIRMRAAFSARARASGQQARADEPHHSDVPHAACMSQISTESGETHLELSRRSSPDGRRG